MPTETRTTRSKTAAADTAKGSGHTKRKASTTKPKSPVSKVTKPPKRAAASKDVVDEGSADEDEDGITMTAAEEKEFARLRAKSKNLKKRQAAERRSSESNS